MTVYWNGSMNGGPGPPFWPEPRGLLKLELEALARWTPEKPGSFAEHAAWAAWSDAYCRRRSAEKKPHMRLSSPPRIRPVPDGLCHGLGPWGGRCRLPLRRDHPRCLYCTKCLRSHLRAARIASGELVRCSAACGRGPRRGLRCMVMTPSGGDGLCARHRGVLQRSKTPEGMARRAEILEEKRVNSRKRRERMEFEIMKINVGRKERGFGPLTITKYRRMPAADRNKLQRRYARRPRA